MQTAAATHLETARRYLHAIETFAPTEVLAEFFTPDVIQDEFPNQLLPTGARRDLDAILQAGQRGKQVMKAQRYDLLSAIAQDDVVVLEVQWVGTLAVPFGSIPPGGEMRARFAVFLEFRGGKIWRQRNYDCFEAW
jgi:ketosteroid isomerase-like protein